eukprot:2696256-Pyramimonas_sp.AAC.1
MTKAPTLRSARSARPALPPRAASPEASSPPTGRPAALAGCRRTQAQVSLAPGRTDTSKRSLS